jgi:putative Holliday junction resolvase
MARIMAFDYGTKRVGIAVTDPLQLIATGLDTVHPKDIVDYLKKYLSTEQAERFVVGDAIQMNGTASATAPHIKGFITILKKHFPDIPIDTIDERFTSKMALATVAQSGLKRSDRRDKDRVDTIAATIILQTWMQTNLSGY